MQWLASWRMCNVGNGHLLEAWVEPLAGRVEFQRCIWVNGSNLDFKLRSFQTSCLRLFFVSHSGANTQMTTAQIVFTGRVFDTCGNVNRDEVEGCVPLAEI